MPLAAHVYPTAVRARGVGTAVAFGRIGAFMTGFIGSWAADMGGTNAFFTVVAGMMVITFISLSLVGRHVPPAGAVQPSNGAPDLQVRGGRHPDR
jgi:MFS transporter, AAHS family, 4-hydroxybenzoate transporter